MDLVLVSVVVLVVVPVVGFVVVAVVVSVVVPVVVSVVVCVVRSVSICTPLANSKAIPRPVLSDNTARVPGTSPIREFSSLDKPDAAWSNVVGSMICPGVESKILPAFGPAILCG